MYINPSFPIAHYYLGQANFHLKNYQKSIQNYKQADSLAKENNFNVGDDICSLLRQAQRAKFIEDEEKRVERLENIEKLVEKCRPFLTEVEESPETDRPKLKSNNGNKRNQTDLKLLEEFLSEAKLKNKRDPPPDAIYGKISFELMHDPVITPSGVTYDRINILEHLARVGHFDPLTRQPLKAESLITNYALKELIDDFIAKNPWVEDDF